MSGTLYLIPVLLGGGDTRILSPQATAIALNLSVFVVENVRSARRFLVHLGIKKTGKKIDELTFLELNKHVSEQQNAKSYLKPALEGNDIGLLSDAGCPAIADPGSDLVREAHRLGIRVVALSGPSSILLALMASGLGGQHFAFNGYLPIKQDERVATIKHIEHKVLKDGQTQIFIETPYRNQTLFADLLQNCSPKTNLSLAINLTLPNERIYTCSIEEWRKKNVSDLHKQMVVFVLGK